MTDFSDGIDDILNKFGAIGVAQHILKGNKKRLDTDWDDLHHQLWDERRHLNSDNLKELIYQAKVLRARQGGLDVPVRDEQPVMGGDTQERLFDKPAEAPHAEHNRFCTEATPCGECKAILDKAAGYDGSTGKRPLKKPEKSSTTIMENIVDALDFPLLIAWAEILKVDHFDIMGDPLDDELPDKEDKLRIAVADAMGKVGK